MSSLHQHWRQGRGHRFYPSSATEHGKLMEVDRVNQRLSEFDNNNAPTLIDYQANRNIGAVYEDKGETKKS